MSEMKKKHQTPGTPLTEWTKDRPATGPNKTTKTVRVISPGEKIPYGPGVPGRGRAR